MIACCDTTPIVQEHRLPWSALCLLMLLNACSYAPPPGDGGVPRVPVVDASAVDAILTAPVVIPGAISKAPRSATVPAVQSAVPTASTTPASTRAAPPTPAPPAPEPVTTSSVAPVATAAATPVPAIPRTSEELVMARSAGYVPTIDWPLPDSAQSLDLQASWLAPLDVTGANQLAIRDRLTEALTGAGFGDRWQMLPSPDGGILLITPVERVPEGSGGRWASQDDSSSGAEQRYRSFVFQVGATGSPAGQVLVYEATRPAANLAAFRSAPSATPLEHLKQAGILQNREALVLATAP